MDSIKVVFDIAHVGDLCRVLDGFIKFREKPSHLRFRLDVKIVDGHLESLCIRLFGACLHAKKDIVDFKVFAL